MRVFILVALIGVSSAAGARAEAPSNEHTQEHAKLAAEVKAADAKIERQLQNVERQLKQEENRMNARLQQLSTMRDKALKSGNQKSLQRVETLEKQAIAQYDARVSRILAPVTGDKVTGATAPHQTKQARTGNSGAPVMRAPGAEKGQQANAAGKSNKSNKRNRPRRRFKLWPF